MLLFLSQLSDKNDYGEVLFFENVGGRIVVITCFLRGVAPVSGQTSC